MPDQYIDQACMEMRDREDATYAMLQATIVSQIGVSTFVRFKHADGTEGPRQKSALAKNFKTMIAGKPVKLADLPEGQEVNVYVGNEYWVAPVAQATEAAAPIATPPPPPPPPEPEPEPEPEVLPTTAGPLPLVALVGVLFLLIGGVMRYSRKRQ